MRIIQEAAEQSRRGLLPVLGDTLAFTVACEQAAARHDLALILWEEPQGMDLTQVLQQPHDTVALMVGPEGGYSSAEVTLAHQCGIIPVTLGPRILRAETAALVAAAITLYSFGDMNK